MNDEDILRITSPEIKEIVILIEEIIQNIEQRIKLNERYLSNKQVRDILFISPRCLQDYRDKGRIPFYKLRSKILYAESDVYKMLERNYNKPKEK